MVGAKVAGGFDEATTLSSLRAIIFLRESSASFMARIPLNPKLLRDVYIDESSQTQSRFLALGGLMVPTDCVRELEQAIWNARGLDLPAGEMKWTKVSTSKLSAYRRVAETILSPAFRYVEFHSVVVDTQKLKDNTFNNGSREVGFNKEIYQLCQKFGRLHRSEAFHIYLDQRETKSTTSELRDILNHGIRKKQPNRDWPYRRVHFRNSKNCICLQAVDILLGAITFHLNDHRSRLSASPAKCELSDLILKLAHVRDVTKDTATAGRFTVWHRQLR